MVLAKIVARESFLRGSLDPTIAPQPDSPLEPSPQSTHSGGLRHRSEARGNAWDSHSSGCQVLSQPRGSGGRSHEGRRSPWRDARPSPSRTAPTRRPCVSAGFSSRAV
jgi:hypothetical protein